MSKLNIGIVCFKCFESNEVLWIDVCFAATLQLIAEGIKRSYEEIQDTGIPSGFFLFPAHIEDAHIIWAKHVAIDEFDLY